MRSPMRAGVCQGVAERTNARIASPDLPNSHQLRTLWLAFYAWVRSVRVGGVRGHIGREVAEQEPGAAAETRRPVVGVVERAAPQREAAAPDALGQLVPQADERRDLRVEPGAPGAGDAVPVGLVRRALARQRAEGVADLREAEADGLRGPDEREAPEHVPV